MTEKIKRLDLNTSEGAQLNMDALYQIAPSVFTESRDEKTGELKRVVNFDALRQLLGDNAVDDSRETYEFRWVGKDAAKAEAARPTDKTLRPVVEDSVDWDTTKNLYIEGDNLEVLKLLQRSYMGKVKMIYIDPPYNTGNDFVYHDDFAMSSEEYDEASGAVDDLGNKYVKNTETSGRFHSDWCNMIYPRLMVARSLLSEDGVIFISIDDNEVENLRKICDEVFGVQNRLDRGCMIWVNRGSSKGFRKIVKNHEYIIAYGKEQSQVNSVYGDNFASSLGTLEHYCFNKPSEKNPYSNVKFS
ncbi:MAG: site-specific DNA-methyltransferase, partial [Prevotella sp.]